MEIANNFKSKVLSYIQDAQNNPDLELEVVLRQGKITKTQFATLLQYLRSLRPALSFKFHEESLSISFKHKNIPYRMEIHGKQNINIYCNTNSIIDIPSSDITLTNKSWVQGKYPIMIDDYDMKINLKLENVIDDKIFMKDIKNTLYSLRKYYRFRKRYSFNSADGLFRYDLTIVKSSDNSGGALNLLSSGLFESQEVYEVEIELTGKKVKPDIIMNAVFENTSMVLRVIDEDDHLISLSTKANVLTNYLSLCGLDKTLPLGMQFVGPMPITLEKKNLLKPELGITSILENYTVTDKADGERDLLYFDNDGKGYLIGRKMVFRNTGTESKDLKGTLLDGEYITKTLHGKAIKTYACFDIYFDRGKNVTHLPLMGDKDTDSRILRMENIVKTTLSGDQRFQLICKTFYGGANILTHSKRIMTLKTVGNIPYKIDGLIFTPKSFPVGAAYDDAQPRLSGTWIKTFKWKPPEDNSIDFLVRTEKNKVGADIVVEKDGQYNKVLKLYVSYDSLTSDRITPGRYFTLLEEVNKKKTKVSSTRFVNRLFEIPGMNASSAYVPIDVNNAIRAENGEIIYDNNVVEFAYKEGTWKALRVRKDKTDGNSYNTAMNVWNSMMNPVTEAMITGEEKIDIDKGEAEEDIYYNRVEERDNSISKPMLDFHNYWVKNVSLVSKLKGRVSSVFDIACGKGNDFPKYLSSDMRTIIGVDKSEDNISEPRDGAYARLLRNINKGWTHLRETDTILFLPLDCSKTIDGPYIEKIKDEDTKELLKVLRGESINPLYSKYHSILKNKMDMVACQFAIHYFFENKSTLRGLIENISNVLRDGGYFIGTCIDGKTIDSKFKQQQKKRLEAKTPGRTLWRIDKEYENFDSINPDNNYGLQIRVYMETINKPFVEYLVDYDLLVLELEKYGIQPLNQKECQELNIDSSTGTFRELYSNMEASNLNNRFIASAKQMTEDQKEYSFMNRWFIFKKRGLNEMKQDKK